MMRSGGRRDDDSPERSYNVNREGKKKKVMILDPLNPFHVIANVRERVYLSRARNTSSYLTTKQSITRHETVSSLTHFTYAI